MSAIKVTDALSNRPEHILEAVKAIGRAERKRKVFEAVYYHKKRAKKVAEIMEMKGLTKMQVLQAGGELKKAGIVEQTKIDGETAYVQIEFFQHNKSKVLAIVDKPARADELNTKRNPILSERISFVKPTSKRKAKAEPKAVRARGVSKATLRVAFLTTNPSIDAPLRTDMEMRAVIKAVQKSRKREYVDIKHLPAATIGDLLEALNEFRPNVIHFSGHGGGEMLVFDNANINGVDGVEINFPLIKEIVSATQEPPKMLVFNACDTLKGAEIFVDKISVVIGMSANVGDGSAIMFSEQFYAALAGGQPVEYALRQGKAVLKAAQLSDADFPSIVSAPTCDTNTLTFVK